MFFSRLRDELLAALPVLTRPLTLFIMGGAAFVATIAGPFGTYDLMNWPVRSLYWLAISFGALLVGIFVRSVTAAWLGHERPIVFDAVATGLMTLVFAPMVWALRRSVDILSGVAPVEFLPVAWNTFMVAAVVFVLRRHLSVDEPGSYLEAEPDLSDETAQAPLPRLYRRLSAGTEGRILRLSGKDHHVEVVTTEGRETLRMRLTDAIDEMDPVEGISTHRSHWVTREAIVEANREKPGKIVLVLSNGDRVPVSRKYKPDLEAAGILC